MSPPASETPKTPRDGITGTLTRLWHGWVREALYPPLDPSVKFERLLENPLLWSLAKWASIGLAVGTPGMLGLVAFPIAKLAGLTTLSWLWILVPVVVVVAGAPLWALMSDNLKAAIAEQDKKTTLDPTQNPDAYLNAFKADEEARFQQNLGDTFVLQALELQTGGVFADCTYRFQSQVNVLLGKNGYGKTILLRTLAALLQKESDCADLLFRHGGHIAAENTETTPRRVRLEVTRNSRTDETVREPGIFTTAAGKIPLLAIPDSRFLNRANLVVAGAPSTAEGLVRTGARHFLTQEPYEGVVQDFLTQLALDFSEAKSVFRASPFERLPIFSLIEHVVRQLTRDESFAFQDIVREDRGFRILVRTASSPDKPLPIQYVSQGTFSIAAIFGLIYNFLRTLHPRANDEEVMGKPGIVIIDELDAHLHPAWQKGILTMLCDRFPNVQFVVSAHSPLIVAGCDWGEVSVLRKDIGSGKFLVDTMERNFLGATARELYDVVFEVDDIDETYLDLATKSTMGREESRTREIESLESKGERTVEEERQLNRLERESRMIGRADEVRRERLKNEADRIEELEAEIRRLKREVESVPRSRRGDA